MSDALRLLTDPSEIQAVAARILGESLGATRVIYIEVVCDGAEVLVHRNYVNGVAELGGRYRLEDYRRNLMTDHQSGHTQVVTNIPDNPNYTPDQKARYREIEVAAHIDVPLIKNNQFVALLAVQQAIPRQWAEIEIALVEETAERTWTAVELARAEAEREQLLQREQTAREAAETANRIKDEFLAVLSHELRSPLNPILGWAKLLQQGKLNAAKTKIALDTIERNAQLQVQLIDDLLDISRILRGKLRLDASPVDLELVISAALETVHLAAEAKSLHIQTTISPDFGAVMGDAGRLQQVVWNLLSNAVKFTPQGGQIAVALTQTDVQAQIQVIDTGKGINPQFLPYVFEHFRQEDGAITRKFGGLGIGLAIARQIVEMHGGSIEVDSPGEGQGATFTVQLPLAPSSQLPSSERSSILTTGDLTGIHLFVVDDEPDSREFIAFALEQAGAIVTRFASGIEALQAIEHSTPNLIVSDIGMPEMDGYVLMQQIRRLESGQHLPAIALTAYAGEFDRQQALQAGFQHHITKPVKPETLVGAIATHLSRIVE